MAPYSVRTWLVVLIAGGVCAGFGVPDAEAAQRRPRPPARYVDFNPPDQAEGARILEEMRHVGIVGYLEFELRILPRAARERRLSGRWFGRLEETGPLARLEFAPTLDTREILLVRGGPQPAVWRGRPDGESERLEGDAALLPLVGTNFSAADLQTPFMFWTDFVYEGRMPVFRSRPAYVFLLYPPEDHADAWPGIGAARVFVDAQFKKMLQAQWLDDAGQALKTITLVSLAKVGEESIPNAFEVRDERTRDKTRFVVTAAALTVELPDRIFTPESLAMPAEIEFPPGAIVPVK